MSSNIAGLLIILFAMLVSVNVIMAMRSESLMLAWLNQVLLGIILITVVSYLVIMFGTKKVTKKEKEAK